MSGARAFPLNGCDAFMLAMDTAIKSGGGSGNLCHLILTFPKGTALSLLSAQIIERPLYQFISKLRLVTPIFRTPFWEIFCSSPANLYSNNLVTIEELHTFILIRTINIHGESPFGITELPLYDEGPSLLFYWHHALCDAHGGEKLIQIMGDPARDDAQLVPNIVQLDSRMKALQRASITKKLIFAKAAPPIARFQKTGRTPGNRSYSRIIFTPIQTSAIDAVSRILTGGIFSMACYLAATARACTTLSAKLGSPPLPIFVPVPHDMRRTTRQRSPLTNQVSFLFFRLDPATFGTFANTTNSIIEQLHDSISGEHHRGMLAFLRIIRRLPSRLLWKLIERPARGHPASLYFSDIGSSLSSLDVFHGIPITRASHYPPHLSPPGLSTVWSRYRGSLEIIICYDAAILKACDIALFKELLLQELLEGAV